MKNQRNDRGRKKTSPGKDKGGKSFDKSFKKSERPAFRTSDDKISRYSEKEKPARKRYSGEDTGKDEKSYRRGFRKSTSSEKGGSERKEGRFKKDFRQDESRRSYSKGIDGFSRSYGSRKEASGKEFRRDGYGDSRSDYRSSDRPGKKFSGEASDRKERKSYGSGKDFKSSERPRKTYSDEGFEKKERKSYGKDLKYSERPRKTYSGEDFEKKERKSYGKDLKYSERPRRTYSESGYEKKETRFAKKESGSYSKKSSYKEKSADDGSVRLNRYIANAGICSRREADELIRTGVITVNGKIITEMGFKVQSGDKVAYGGETLRREKMVYVLLNKPKDFITTTEDPENRKTVMQLVHNAGPERIFPVGRLDRNTTGLLLFTNDGDLAKKLMHPRYGIKKIYHVTLDKNLAREDFEKIQEGLNLEDGFIKADELNYVGDGKDKNEIGIEIHSGRNRIIRRIFEHLGYTVVHLDRVYYAGLTKKDLPRGRWRFLSEMEVNMMKMLS